MIEILGSALACVVAGVVGFAMHRSVDSHQCRDRIEHTHYSPPAESFSGKLTHAAFRAMSEGVTHIYFRCQDCGRVREQDVFGHFEPKQESNSEADAAMLRRLGIQP